MIPTLRFSVILPILQRDVSQIWAPKVIMKGFPLFFPCFFISPLAVRGWMPPMTPKRRCPRRACGACRWRRRRRSRRSCHWRRGGAGRCYLYRCSHGEKTTMFIGISPPLLKMAGYGLWMTCQWGIEPPSCGTLMLGKWWWANRFRGFADKAKWKMWLFFCN